MEKKGYPNKTNRKIGYDIFRIFACFGVILNHTILIYDRYGEIHPWKYLVVTALFCLCKSAVTIYLLKFGSIAKKRRKLQGLVLQKIITNDIYINCMVYHLY